MRLKKKRSQSPASALVGPGAAVAGAVTGAYLFARGRSRAAQMDRDTGEPATDQRQEWRCECGELLLVTGEGRHRVFWLADAALEDPVLGDRCPNCERDLSAQD